MRIITLSVSKATALLNQNNNLFRKQLFSFLPVSTLHTTQRKLQLQNQNNGLSEVKFNSCYKDKKYYCNDFAGTVSWQKIFKSHRSSYLGAFHFINIVRFYTTKNKDFQSKSVECVNFENDSDENGKEESIQIHQENPVHNDPWIKSLLADIQQDFASEVRSETESRVIQTDQKEDITRTDSTSGTSSGDYEYDYRYADIEEFGYHDERETMEEKRPEKQLPISLDRGDNGVFEVEEMITLMEHLGAENVVSFPVPPEANYCDHMVVVTAKSKRHLQAINDEMLWVHKRKKGRKDPTLLIEGLAKKSEWCAMDLGNLVLHVFLNEETRQYYDIESLWTLGPENDPKCQETSENSFVLSAEDLFWLETTHSGAMDTVEAKDTDHKETR